MALFGLETAVEKADESADKGSNASEEEGDTLAGLNLLPGLQLGGRGRSRGGRSRGGRSRSSVKSRGRARTRASRGRRGRMQEEGPPTQLDLQHYTALLADPGIAQEGQMASLLALQALEVKTEIPP